MIGLVGCQNSTPKFDDDPNIAPLVITPGKATSSYDGIEIQIDSLNWNKEENKTTLVVVWNNRTEYEVTYGASFAIERLDGEEWVSCAIPEDPVFNLMAYLLPAGRLTNEFYTVTDMFDVSSPGTYRFITDCLVPDNAEQSTKCELTAEFTLGNSKCPDDSKEVITEVEWVAQYIRTNGYQDGAKFPRVKIIKTTKELNEYYNANNRTFDLERKDKVYSDTTIGFLDACDQYDDAFFETNYLMFILLEEGSGSVRHEVFGVTQTTDKKISVCITRDVPEAGTADMAEWHIFLELSREVIVETANDVLVYLDGNLAWNGSVVEPPKPEPAFKTPPKGTLRTPEGDVTLTPGGYDWTVLNSDGTATTTIADQASRPLTKDSLKPVTINSKYAETIYFPVPGSSAYEPTNSLGYLVKFGWEADPSRVTCTCWPDTVWKDSSIQGKEMSVDLSDDPFYAKEGGYIYEFAVTWDDTGAGYHGTANYYVYIVGGDDHSHQVATTAQTVEDPVTGYCGNTQTTLYIGDKEYSFMYGHSVTLTDILANLNYDPMRVCRCRPEYTVDTEFGTGYGINLTAGYARCDKGQADLTQEQIDAIAEIIEWAETTNCRYPINN